MNSMPFRQLKSFLKILIGVQYDTTNEGGTVSLILSMEKPLLSFGESNLILIITILVCNTLVNKVTGASLDKGIGG